MIDDKIYNNVVTILKAKPECRDSDVKLAFFIWAKQSVETINDFSKTPLLKFLGQLDQGELYQLSSITRARRLAQSNFPDLRGKKWLARQKKATNNTKKFIVKQSEKDLRNSLQLPLN